MLPIQTGAINILYNQFLSTYLQDVQNFDMDFWLVLFSFLAKAILNGQVCVRHRAVSSAPSGPANERALHVWNGDRVGTWEDE